MVVTRVLACSCNGTVDIDSAIRQQQGDALLGGAALGIGELCRRDFRHFTEALEGTDDVLVTCTQESALFNEIAQARSAVAPIRFVNVRERAGWGREGAAAGPKIAALVAMASAAQAPRTPQGGENPRPTRDDAALQPPFVPTPNATGDAGG